MTEMFKNYSWYSCENIRDENLKKNFPNDVENIIVSENVQISIIIEIFYGTFILHVMAGPDFYISISIFPLNISREKVQV